MREQHRLLLSSGCSVGDVAQPIEASQTADGHAPGFEDVTFKRPRTGDHRRLGGRPMRRQAHFSGDEDAAQRVIGVGDDEDGVLVR